MRRQQLWTLLQQGIPNTLLSTTSAALAGLVSGLLLARSLGPGGRGQFAIVVLWPSVLSMLAEFGLGLAMAYFAGKKREAINELWSLAWIVSLIGGGALCIVGSAALPSHLGISGEVASNLRWNMATVPLILFTGYSGYLLLGMGYLLEFNLVRTSAAFCYALGVVGVTLLNACSITAFTIVFIIAQIASCTLGITLSVYRLHPEWCWQAGSLKPVLQYGLKVYASGLMAQANLRLDQIIMTFSISPVQLGLYVVAVAASNLLSPIYIAFATVTLQRVTRASELRTGVREALRHLRLLCLFGAPLTIGLLVFLPWLLPRLFGENYELAVRPAQLLLLAAFFQGIVITLGNCLRGLGYPGKTTISEGIGLLTTIFLLITLLPILGILGAAITSMVAYGFVTVAQIAFLIRVSGISASDLFWAYILCNSKH